ncbi:hypothetical protein ACOMHN_021463 [Nucella lapillus]
MKGQGQGQGQGQSQGQGQGQSHGQGQSQGQVDAILEYLGPLSVYAVIQWAAFAVCMIPISFQMFAIVFTGRDVPHDCSPMASKNTSLDHVTEILWVSETGELANNATNITSSLYNVSSASMLDRGKGLRLTSTTAMLELFPARLRTLATAVSGGVLFALTSATIGPVAYALRFESWRTMQLVFTSASLVLILQIIFLDEPLRALLATNKHKEALKVIRKAARWNNKDMNHLQEQFRSLIHPDPPASSPSSPSSSSPTKDPTMDDDLNPKEHQQSLLENVIPNNYEFRPRGDELAINEQNLSSSKTDASFCVEDGGNGNIRPLNRAYLTEELKLPTESASHSRDSDVEDVVDLSMLGMKDKRTYFAVSVDSFDENGLRNQESSSCLPKSNEDMVDGRVDEDMVDHLERIEDHVGILKDGQDSGTEVGVKGHPGSQVTGSGKRRKVNIMDLLRHRRMRIHVLIACLLWNQSIGIASATGRTAIMLAPFASTLAQHFPWAPGLVLGGLSLLSVCCLFFVPETAGRELPQTVDDLDRWFHKEGDAAAAAAVEAQAGKSV